MVFLTACFAVSTFAIWRANTASSFGTLEAISGNDVVALLTPAYFWLNSHWKPGSSAIVFLYLLWFHVVYTSLLRPGRVLCSAHKNNYYTDILFCALSIALFCHEVCTLQVLPDIVVFNSEVKPMQYTFSKLTMFPGQDLFIYSVCCEMP